LVVEDHADTAAALSRLLQGSGFGVVVARDMLSARLAADSEHLDLVLCDLELPDGDGCDLMAELHAVHELDGIILTGHATPRDAVRVRQAGFLCHLTKPISFERLMATIEDFFLGRLTTTGPGSNGQFQ